MQTLQLTIIGAGVAGLACARVLVEAGVAVRVVDKGRGPGGRCSSRRSPAGRFDHGANFFTARDPRFLEQVETWRRADVVAPWNAKFNKACVDGETNDPWFVGTPGMNAMVRWEADALQAEFSVQCAPLTCGQDRRYILRTEMGQEIGEADFVVVATPAPQAAALLPATSPLRKEAAGASMLPCWTLMIGFEEAIEADVDAWLPQSRVLDAVFSQAPKPGRDPGSRYVVHGTAGWSEDHLEDDPEAVAEALLRAFRDETGILAAPVHLAAHRWRYARVGTPCPGPFGFDLENNLATCGDWHIAPRIESAWVSGHELGQRLVQTLV